MGGEGINIGGGVFFVREEAGGDWGAEVVEEALAYDAGAGGAEGGFGGVFFEELADYLKKAQEMGLDLFMDEDVKGGCGLGELAGHQARVPGGAASVE